MITAIIRNLFKIENENGYVSHKKKIFIAAVVIALLTVIVKATSLVKELFVANYFGRNDAIDAFIMAFLVPSFIINLIGGSFNSALIPKYVEVRQKNDFLTAQKLLSNVLFLSASFLTGIVLILFLISPELFHLLASGFGASKLELTLKLFNALLPIILINGLAITWGSILNASEKFALVPLASLSVPLVIIIVLSFGGDDLGIYALTYGTVLGFLLEAIVIACGLKRHGLLVFPRWCGMDNNLIDVIKQYLPMAVGAVLMNSTILVDNIMAATLDPGSVSALSYGNRIVAAIIGIGATSLGTAALPYFSKMAANNKWIEFNNTLHFYLRLVFLSIIPLSIILILNSEIIVGIVFERGAFNRADTTLVANVQSYFLLQIPFYIAGMLIVKLISAMKKNRILMYGTMISVSLNIILNYIGIKYLGVAGIALSTSLVYMVSFFYLYSMLRMLINKASS